MTLNFDTSFPEVTVPSESDAIFEFAQRYLPGGVSSTSRLVEPNLTFTQAQGAYMFDAAGRRYIDYFAAFGPLILGHCHPAVNQYVSETLLQTDLIGVGANELEARLAQKIVEHVPSAEKVLFCNSGSEATYAAIRLARAVTGRPKIIKFQGCYHGWHDAVLMNVASSPDKIGQKDPRSAGIVAEVINHTLVLPFNDLEQVTETIQREGENIAAVILEPVPHSIGCILPQPEFLEGLRSLTNTYGIVLIFDEVVSGFRHGLGGYQKVATIKPDLTTLGKALANGYPIAALCGREDLMARCSPHGDVFFAGTYNGHPVGVAAALATIAILEKPESYSQLFDLGERLRQGLRDIFRHYDIEAVVAGFGSVFVTYFMLPPINSYTDLLRNNTEKFLAYRRKMIENDVYMLPVNLKRNHISLSHTPHDIDHTLEVAESVLKRL